MSMNFDEAPNEATKKLMDELFGKPAATDGKSFLFDKLTKIDQKAMKEIANTAKQPVKVEIHAEDEIKTLADGTRYRVTDRGWVRMPPDIPAQSDS